MPRKVSTFRAIDFPSRHCFCSNYASASAENDANLDYMENEDDLFSKRLSCFMHFDGVSEQLCKVTHLWLKKFIDVRHK